MRMRTWHLLAPLSFMVACSSDESKPPIEVEPVEDGCPSIFAQDVMPDFEVEIDDDEWAALEYEFHHRDEAIEAEMEEHPYHPIVFRHEGDVVEDAMIRLKGASSWAETIAFDDDPKMQFVISFNENNPDGRYRGRRKLSLDMPRSDWTFLRQRLALYGLRSLGAPAQCANSARLFINGEYYGLYANVERMDRELLERIYPDSPDGDLWKGGRIIKTNEDDFTWTRLSAFWDLPEMGGTADDLSQMADLEASIKVWAAEAVVPHADGYYMGRANFYLYDHPERGFVWLPEDLDSAFDFLPSDTDALFPPCDGRSAHDREHYLMVMDDPEWRQVYLDELAAATDRYNVADMESKLDQWKGQIADAAAEDRRGPSAADHELALASMRDYFAQRTTFLEDWVGCLDSGGPDEDGDGVEFCRDCGDDSKDISPGVNEVCNGVDDNCDGHIDEVADCSLE